jgi:23S rRNA (guanosine2251-2'-O)-methyltransferase
MRRLVKKVKKYEPKFQRSSPFPGKSEKSSEPGGPFSVDSFSALEEYLKHRPQAIKKIISTQNGLNKISHHKSLVGIPVEIVEAGSPGSNGKQISALVEHTTMDEATFYRRIAGRKTDLILALDHITDPRNLGAIARSAAYFGIKEIIVPSRRQVLLTDASVATAQGAFAFVDLVEVVNLNRFLRKLKEMSYWVLTADMAGESLGQFKNIYERSVLVMGAEDKGISPVIKNISDRTITIAGADTGLGSLNVSVAAGILLRGLFDQQKK